MPMSDVQLCGICKKEVEGQPNKVELYGQPYEAHDVCRVLVEEYQKTDEYKKQFITVTKYTYGHTERWRDHIDDIRWKIMRKWVERNPTILAKIMGNIKAGQAVSMSAQGTGEVVPFEDDPNLKIVKNFEIRQVGITLQPYQKKLMEDTDSKIISIPARQTGQSAKIRGHYIDKIITDDIIMSKQLIDNKTKNKMLRRRFKKKIRKSRFHDFETKIKTNWDDPDYEMDRQNKRLENR